MDLMHTLARAIRALATRGVLLAACALLAAPPALAQWKWISSAGVVQYSDQPPPPNIPAKNILAKPLAATTAPHGPSASAAASSAAPPAMDQAQTQAARDLQQKLEQDKRAKEAAQNLQKQIEAQARQANCLQAQRQLQTLDSGVRLAEVDPQGNRAYITDAQRAAQRQQAAAAIAANCR